MTGIQSELLDPERKKTFLQLQFLGSLGGVLGGGTAIMLQIGHRLSFDFDVFFGKKVLKRAFKIANQRLNIKEKRVDQPNQITFVTKEGIQVTFLYYEFLPLYPMIKSTSLPLFNLKDLAADKAYTLGRRSIWRDYVDIFFLLKDKRVNLGEILEVAPKKFKAEFAPKLFLEQLTYYQDIKDFKIEFIGKEYSPKEVQEFLKKEVRQYIHV